MQSQFEKIIEVQKEAWNKSSQGWKKWDGMMMNFLKPMNVEMIRMLDIKGDEIVLDVATGTGEPGLTIASMLKSGKVVGIDLSENMLVVAIENANKRSIKNFETVCGDVTSLPFDDVSFDVITCRLGFMLFPDMQLALKEMLRVLKPGGRIVASVWDVPEKNSWVNASMSTMISMLQLKPPAEGAPGMYRCAQQNLMTDLFKQEGMRNIQQKVVTSELPWVTLETYWDFISEVASPTAFKNADESMQNQIKEEVLRKVSQLSTNGKISVGSSTIVICGEK